MPVNRHYLPDSSLSICVYSGVLDADTILRNLRDHVNDPLYRPTMAELADLSGVTRFDLEYASLARVASGMTGLYTAPKTLSIFAPGDVAFGIGRMYAALCRQSGPLRAHVHRTEAEALAQHRITDMSLSAILAGCIRRD